mmetsp:Transcript_26585/g.75898  ORF Transcript_26585/g.75898 Transcript_26585/m.75898 type:complete len:207 (-) Transcript_26585:1588-2208(-)
MPPSGPGAPPEAAHGAMAEPARINNSYKRRIRRGGGRRRRRRRRNHDKAGERPRNKEHALELSLHAEYTEALVLIKWLSAADPKALGQGLARVLWRDDAVVPKPRRRVVDRAFALILLQSWPVELCQGSSVHLRLALSLQLVLLHRGQHARRLLAAHDAHFCVRPREHEARVIGASAHGVGSRTVASSDDDCDLGHGRASYSVYHL